MNNNPAAQMAAFRRALAIADASEDLVRGLIIRDLLGYRYWSVAKVLVTINKLLADIARVRVPSMREAFLQLRRKLGNEPVAGNSLSAWCAAFCRVDARAIRMVIETAIAEQVSSEEVARRVCGSLALNSIDGILQQTRFQIAWLGRSWAMDHQYDEPNEDDGAAIMAASQKLLDAILALS